ncbi:MAG: S8 family serine peptidase, partial [Bacteroidales bacterium]|nr:S8 family serine peptidase [Bacteroidales bacterium]MDY5447032.1 S8 family serine peptidase [Sodaliphilus sp.]
MNFKKYFATIFCLLGIFTAGAYEKMSVATQAFLDNRSAFPSEAKRHAAISQVRGQEMVDVFITLHDSQNTSRITALGGVIGARFTGLVTAQVPVAKLQAIAALDEVEQVSIAEMMESNVDTTRSVTSVNYVAEGLQHGLPANYDGKGVVFGIIDSGIDFNHAAFQDSLGNTRIKCVYMPADNSGTKVTIDGTVLPGSEFDSTRIASLTTDLASSAHGSHTAFIGAGSHCGQYSGMAPGADIVMCALGGKKNDVNIANSLKYITQYAKRVGKPCVISISLGTKQGPHDGTSKLCKIYEEMGKSDAVICLSAGNLGSYRRYIHHKFSGMNTATNPNIGSYVTGTQAGYTANFAIDTWSRSRSAVGIKYLLIDPDDNSIFYETGIMKAYTYHYIGPGMESKRGYNAFLSQYFSGKIGVWVTTESNGHIETYSEVSLKPLRSDVKAYKMAVQFYGADGVEFDSWVTSENAYSWHPQVGDYKFVNGSDSCSMNDNVTGKNTISVGNYVGRNRYMSLSGKEMYNSIYPEGSIYVQSSYGIAPNGESYPFVAAPGYFVVSAYNGYNYLAKPSTNTAYSKENPTTGRTDYWGSMSGTSMSTPTVAGIVALWLQANPQLKVDDVKEIIRKSAYVDDDVRKAPLQFGAGKINALGGFPEFQYRLTDVISNSRLDVDHYYSICDSSLTCARVSADGRTIYAKDSTRYARQDVMGEGQIDYIKSQHLMPDSVAYDQSNWVLIHLPQPLDSLQKNNFVGRKLKNVGGVLKSKKNLEFEADKMPVAVMDTPTPQVLNTFIPANFHGSQTVDSQDYFFVRPKPMEVDTIRGAYWNATKSQLEMPEGSTPAFQGSASVDFSYSESPADVLAVNSHYDIVAMTKYGAAGELVVCPLEILKEKVSEHTIAEIIATPSFKSGYSYVVNDSSLRVMYVSSNGSTLYVKDDGGYATPEKPTTEQTVYQKGDYDQSNWLALHLPQALDDVQKAQYKGKLVKSFRGVLENKVNMSFKLIDMPQMAETDTTVALNSFIPANLQGSQMVDSVSYFLMRPKPMEIDTIRSVMWNGFNKTIEMPYNPEKYGMLAFKGVAKVDTSLYETDSVKLNDNYVYDMIALTTVAADSSLLVYPLQAWNERVTQFPLSQVVNDAHFKEGMNCELEDSSLVVMYVAVGAKQLYAKDYGQYATPDIPTEQQTDVLKGDYDQSNWVVLNLPEPLDSAQCAAYIGRQLTGVKGVIRSIANPTIDCEINPVAGEKDTTAVLNSFIPANFLGSQKVDSVDYFFVRPKPMEIDTVRCAMWCQTKREFIMPYFADEYGFKNFNGGFKPDYSKLTTTRPIIKDGDVCEMVVLTDVNASKCYPLEILSVKPTEFTLAKMLKSPTIPLGYAYPIADNTLTVMGFSDDYFTIYAKDDNQYATPDVPDSTQVDYQEGNYDQSNWVAIYMPDAIDAEKADDIRGRYIINMNAMLISKQSPEMEVYDILTFGEKNENAKMNTFLPANFLGSQKVDSVNYFLVRPKPMEIDTVRCAMWNKAADRFEMPFVAADFGVPQFEGAMKPVFMLTEGDKSDLKDGYVYDLLVQTRMNDNETFGYVSKVLDEQKPSYSLASMLSVDRMKENATYSVKADDLTVMHISTDSLTIYAKDAANGVNATVPADGQTDYLGSDKYAQHNWVAITLPQPLDSAQMADFPGRHILGFDAELTSKAGAELKAVAVPAVGEKDTIAYVNSYIAANFLGSQAVGDKNYFFAKPAAMEIDTVRCVQWDAFFSTFSAPLKASEWGMPQFDGKFKVDLSHLEVDSVSLQDNFVYDIVTLNTVAADGSNKVYLLEVVRELGGKKPLVGDMNNDGLVDV